MDKELKEDLQKVKNVSIIYLIVMLCTLIMFSISIGINNGTYLNDFFIWFSCGLFALECIMFLCYGFAESFSVLRRFKEFKQEHKKVKIK